MKAFIAAAVVVAAMPVVGASGQDGAATAKQERRTCRWVEARAASRMKLRRVCMTSLQWRALTDTSVDDEMTELSVRSQSVGGWANGVTPKGESPR